MGDGAVAGVHDPSAAENERNAGNGSYTLYINAGVMLMNLAAWRDVDIAGRAIRYSAGKRVRFPDQTAINEVCRHCIKIIPSTWNFLVKNPEIPKTLPRIVHYVGSAKPWLTSRVEFADLYAVHRERTPFGFVWPRDSGRSRLKLALNLAIMRRKYRRLWRIDRLARSHIESLSTGGPAQGAAGQQDM